MLKKKTKQTDNYTEKSKDDLLLEVIRKRVVTKKIREDLQHEEKERKAKEEPQQRVKKLERRIVTIKEATVKTPIDDLYDAITKSGKIRMDIAAKKFKVPESRIEEWGKILEENNLIEIHYPAIGKPMLAKKEQ